jgi:hypothetical protein
MNVIIEIAVDVKLGIKLRNFMIELTIFSGKLLDMSVTGLQLMQKGELMIYCSEIMLIYTTMNLVKQNTM